MSKPQCEMRAFISITAFSVIFFSLVTASASRLDPGETISLRRSFEPLGADLVATTNFTFASDLFTGTLITRVWENDLFNPWGGLTFSYRLSNTGSCEELLGLFTLYGFGNSPLDVNYSGFGTDPRQVTRSASGDAITFKFIDRHGHETLSPGDSSSWLIVQTAYHSWGVGQIVTMDSIGITAATYVPLPVPEPTMGTFALASALSIWVVKRRKS